MAEMQAGLFSAASASSAPLGICHCLPFCRAAPHTHAAKPNGWFAGSPRCARSSQNAHTNPTIHAPATLWAVSGNLAITLISN